MRCNECCKYTRKKSIGTIKKLLKTEKFIQKNDTSTQPSCFKFGILLTFNFL